MNHEATHTATPFDTAHTRRPRRLRRTRAIRGLVRETLLPPNKLVLPLFLEEGENVRAPIAAMPGVERRSVDNARAEIQDAMGLGVCAFALFANVPKERKSHDAAEALHPGNLNCRALRAIKEALPEACLITDVALDPYSSMGHDGVVVNGEIANDETVALLEKMAVLHADNGADIVAPSDMMDGRVGAIRGALDAEGHDNTAILSYTAKYASAFYGPFREALQSAPAADTGAPSDKSTYQMDPANTRESLVEAALDAAEAADMLMVKPAMAYLDIVAQLRAHTDLPIAAYHVSGEYAMAMAAGERGWIDADACIDETLLSIARAGADTVFTYAAKAYAKRWRERWA